LDDQSKVKIARLIEKYNKKPSSSSSSENNHDGEMELNEEY